ncbi:MAG: O-antigen ligase family protein [Chloroflexota bacterium]
MVPLMGNGAATPADAPRPGPLDLYRALGDAFARVLPRRVWSPVVEVVLIVAYLALRTGNAPRDVLAGWVAAAAVLALLHPGAGLTVFAVMAVFSEPFVLTRDLGAKPIVVGALAVGLALRLVRRPRDLPWSLPIALGLAVVAGTLAGVGVVAARSAEAATTDALIRWITGPATMGVVLVAAAWTARRGSLRPLVVVTAAGVVAGVAGLADFFSAAGIRETALDWLVRPTRFETRLAGVIPSPNGVAALVIGPFAICAAAAVLGRTVRLPVRFLAAAGAAILAVAMYFTYSRAALLGIFVVGVVVAWRIRRWLGAGLLVAGIVAGALVLPGYLASRAAAVGGGGEVDPNGVLVASDLLRLRAWTAASAIWADNPLLGVGFGQYGLHADAYGDAVLNAPHNEWLRLFAEEGTLVGLIGVFWIGATVLALRRAPGWLGAGALATALGWGLAATFNNPLLFIQVSTVAFTIVGTGLTWRPPPAAPAASRLEASAPASPPVEVPAPG